MQHLYIWLFEKCDYRVLRLDSNVLSLRWLIWLELLQYQAEVIAIEKLRGKTNISFLTWSIGMCFFSLCCKTWHMRFESSVSQGKQGQVSGERPNKVWRLMKLISRCYLCISLGNKWVCSSLFSWFLILLIKGCERKIFFF